MNANESNDDRADKPPGRTGPTATYTGEDYDTAMAEYPTRSARSSTKLWLPHDGDANLDVYAYDYDDEPGQVELCVGITGAHLTLNLTPADACALASDLEDAAGRATDGD